MELTCVLNLPNVSRRFVLGKARIEMRAFLASHDYPRIRFAEKAPYKTALKAILSFTLIILAY
jgi:hypothetical protein